MFSTPLICCSSGVATVRATVSAEAPGYTVVICTVGGTISGYCATGRIASAPSPRSVTKALSTVAKRGRSIKKCARRIFLARSSPDYRHNGSCRPVSRLCFWARRAVARPRSLGRSVRAPTGSLSNRRVYPLPPLALALPFRPSRPSSPCVAIDRAGLRCRGQEALGREARRPLEHERTGLASRQDLNSEQWLGRESCRSTDQAHYPRNRIRRSARTVCHRRAPPQLFGHASL